MSASPPGSPGDGAARSIASRIRRSGPISFRDFHALALHDPETGYYARGPERLGPAGDFLTSPEVSAGFGACLAIQVAEMDRLLGHPDPFTLVELGSGGGRLATDLLAGFAASAPDLARRFVLVLVDASPGMRTAARARLADRIEERRLLFAESLDEAVERPGPFEGAIVSNEFYDALPVHLVTRQEGALQEVFVDIDPKGDPDGNGGSEPARFIRVLRPVDDPRLSAYARRYGVAEAEGSEGEIGLEALAQIRSAARALRRGFHMAVDYGDEAPRLYRTRPRGTLLAYREHRTSEDVLDRPGDQDITAHVNFTALMDEGAACGLATTGRTSQDRFLVALGLADEIAALAGRSDAASIRRRLALGVLIHPEGMGRTFSVLVQHAGIPFPALTGLKDPFAGGLAVPAGAAGHTAQERGHDRID